MAGQGCAKSEVVCRTGLIPLFLLALKLPFNFKEWCPEEA